jgi:Xaa-Pro aminopeptidase
VTRSDTAARPFDASAVACAARAAVPALLEAVRERVAAAGADALLVTAPASVRYLSGFTTPEDARVVVTPDTALLVTDDRYTLQAAEESWLDLAEPTDAWPVQAAKLAAGRRLAVEAEHLTMAQQRTLEEALQAPVVATEGLLRPLRVVKREFELAWLREAARITDAAITYVTREVLRPGVREVDVALELERAMRAGGAEAVGFDIIVASGPRSAMPHGVASDRRIEAGDLVTIDLGARVDGYHADMTRAFAVGGTRARERGWYDAVLEALEAALAAIRPGLSGPDAYAVARDVLRGAGLDEAFVHSLGHGTGLEIHEAPRLSAKSTDVLQPGMVVTVEPGVYLPGEGGVRIEDLVLVTEDGHEVLSRTPKTYTQV